MHDSRYVDAFPDARFRAGGCDSAAAAGINGNEIVFSRAGDLWRVGKAGGAAVRLTTGQGMETYPVFSPDGETVAFSGEYDGNFDVYTVPVAGGVPKRITDYPGIDEPAAWTNDGKHIVFRSGRSAVSRYRQRFRIPAEGGSGREAAVQNGRGGFAFRRRHEPAQRNCVPSPGWRGIGERRNRPKA
jgi:Tol biopolymer transport system component